MSRDASLACRLNKTADDRLMLYVDNRWDYPEIALGNYCKTIEALLRTYRDAAEIAKSVKRNPFQAQKESF